MKTSRIVLVIVILGLLAGVSFYSYATVENNTVRLVASKPDEPPPSASPYSAEFTFPGVADMEISGYCQNTNISAPMCRFDVLIALPSPNSPEIANTGLATKTITLELLGSPMSSLSVVSYQGSNALSVSYRKDDSGSQYATVNTPATFGGATWDFEFLVLNAPSNSTGQAALSMVFSANLAHTGYIGHDYNIQAAAQFPMG